jgi:hypothetical protein
MEKVAIYTVMLGGYDDLTQQTLTNGADHFLFTDDESNQIQGFKTILIDATDDIRTDSRHYKILVHRYLPEYNLYIYFDANYTITKDLRGLIKSVYRDNTKVSFKRHPSRNCIYTEASRVKMLSKAEPQKVDKQVEEYRKNGYPQNAGLYECNFFIRANDKKINTIFEDWYKELTIHTHRDQLSLPVVLKRHKFIPTVFTDVHLSRFTRFRPHKKATTPTTKKRTSPLVHYFTPASGDKNLGRAYNKACEMVTDLNDWICIRDGDTMFLTPDWCSQIEEIIEANGDNYQLISCLTNRLGLKHQLLNGELSQDTDVRNHTNLAIRQRDKYRTEVVTSPSYTAGLFMLFKRSLWDTIKFKEGLTSSDESTDFIDAQFSKGVLKQGGRIGLAKGIYLFHAYRLHQKTHRDWSHLL